MSKCDKLLKKAQNSPTNLRFEELCQLAECNGFIFKGQISTSHRKYQRPGYKSIMNFQDDHGKAKDYQVRQLLAAIEVLGNLDAENEETDG